MPSNRVISSSEWRPRVLAFDHGTDGVDIGLIDQARFYRVLGFAEGDGLGDFVGEDGGAGQDGGVDFLLAGGVGAHAGQMGAGADVGVFQDRRERRSDRDDHIRLRAELVKFDRLERQAEFFGDGTQTRQHVGVVVPGDDAFEFALFYGGAELEGGLMACADHAENACVFAGEMGDRD